MSVVGEMIVKLCGFHLDIDIRNVKLNVEGVGARVVVLSPANCVDCSPNVRLDGDALANYRVAFLFLGSYLLLVLCNLLQRFLLSCQKVGLTLNLVFLVLRHPKKGLGVL